MPRSDEVYRAVNQYEDYSTGETMLKYSKVYDQPGHAKAYATRMRCPYGKSKPPQKILNPRRTGSYFEFVATWCERATEWSRV